MKKFISLALFGDNPYYLECFKKIIERKKITHTFNDWQILLYISSNYATKNRLSLLQNHSKITIIIMNDKEMFPIFWRFLALNQKNSIVIFRDIDSYFLHQDEEMVNAWLNSAYPAHCIHSFCPFRGYKISAGTWGCRTNVFDGVNIVELIKRFLIDKKDYYGIDEVFLSEIIFPIIQDQTLFHIKNDINQHIKGCGIKPLMQKSSIHTRELIGPKIKLFPEDSFDIGARIYLENLHNPHESIKQ